MNKKLENILIDNNINGYQFIKDKNLFESKYSNAMIISQVVLLSEKLLELGVDYIIDEHYNVRVKI